MTAKARGTLGFTPSITVAGKNLSLDGLVIITAFSQTVPNHLAGFSEDGGLTNYQVPNGMTLRVHAIKAMNTAAANSAGAVGSGTAAVLLGGQATPPAGDVALPYLEAFVSGGAVGDTGEVACDFTIGQNRYPYGLGTAGGSQIQMFGYLE